MSSEINYRNLTNCLSKIAIALRIIRDSNETFTVPEMVTAIENITPGIIQIGGAYYTDGQYNLSSSNGIEQEVYFTSNGTNFKKIIHDGMQSLSYVKEDNTVIAACVDGSWQEDAYRYISFPTTNTQGVSTDFYNWFRENFKRGDLGNELILQSKAINPQTTQLIVSPDTGFDGLSSVTVKAMKLGDLNINTPNIDGTPDTYYASDKGYDGFSSVTVEPLNFIDVEITENGTYNYADITQTSNVLIDNITVNVPTANLIEKVVTPTNYTQELLPSDQGADGYLKVTVNPIPTTTISPITANGTYSIEQLTGDSNRYPDSIPVNVPSKEITLQTKTVSPSSLEQTVTPDDEYDGLSSVIVTACSGTKYITSTSNTTVSGFKYARVYDNDLVASNIKSGVEILGVTGTYTGTAVSNTTCTVTVNGNGQNYYVPTISNGKYTMNTGYISSSTMVWSNVPSGSVIVFDSYMAGSPSISGSATLMYYADGSSGYAVIHISSSATGTITITL